MIIMRQKRAQIRVVEAIIACSLIIIGHLFISSSTSSMTTTKAVELEILVQNLLNSLGDQDVMFKIVDKEENASYSLKQIVESILPPDILYNVSLTSLVDNEVLANTTNMLYSNVSSRGETISMQGMNTVTFPIQARKPVDLDVSLLIDRSQSMGDTISGDDRSKLDYTKTATCLFVDLLDNAKDRVGLVYYHTHDNIERALTLDHEYIKSEIIHNSATAGQTNITRGLEAANLQFLQARSDVTRCIILLTDGKDTEPSLAIAQADIAKSGGARIYTIGLGEKMDIYESLLKQLNSSDGAYFYAPSGRDLETIYNVIGKELTMMVKYDIVLVRITLMKT